MKQVLLSIGFVVTTFAVFSQTPCPTQFLRTNGNNSGCGAHVKLYFASCPTTIPTLDSIKINGVLEPQTFTIIGKTCNGGNTYIDYCISDANLPPASQITVFLTYADGAIGGTSGSTICNVPSAGTTPVVLSAFSIQRSDDKVNASWQTQQESNSSSFEIERAYDNANFEKIGTIPAAGNSSAIKNYTFTDNSNISKAESFYRIKMIDIDGAFVYTQTKSVKGSTIKTDFVISPNPNHGSAKITLNNVTEPTEVQVLDVSGRMVKSILLSNSNTAEINNLHVGSYFVRVVGKITGLTSVKKLSVME
jgi:Secretion system C-terminal sorting domain